MDQKNIEMKKFFKAMDGLLYMDVTEKALKIFDSNLFELFAVWQKGETIYKIPVLDREELDVAISYGKYLCIEVGPQCHCNPDRWSDADKIIHEGYVYVKYSDIKP